MPMTIDGDGSITGLVAGGLPNATIVQADLATGVAGNGPAFSAYLGTSQTVTIGVATKIQFNTEVFDTASAFDSTTNYRFQPLVAGYYQVNGMVYGSASTTLQALYCQINKTGTLYQYSSIFQVPAGVGSSPLASAISTIIYLNGSTDYIELFGTISGSGTCTFTTTTGTTNYFNAVLVRAA